MKTRPKPKKISFIKLTTNNKTESKLNNKKISQRNQIHFLIIIHYSLIPQKIIISLHRVNTTKNY